MVQKQAAFSSRLGSDSFADDDPLAELARIVGFEPPAARDVAPARPAAAQEPHFNLEDELLREFEVYDAPLAPSRGAEPVAVERPVSPAPEFEELEDVFYPEPIVEPVAPVQAARVEPAFEPEIRHEPSFSVDLADELELAVSEPDEVEWHEARHPVQPEPEPKLRLPLANFSAQPPARIEPPVAADLPVQPAPSVDHGPVAATKPAAVDDFFADQDFQWSDTVSGPSSAVSAAPVSHDADPFDFGDLSVEADPFVARPSVTASPAAPLAASRAEPSFSFADELAASEDFTVAAPSVPPVAASRSTALELPAQAAPAPRIEPAVDRRPPIEEEEFDPFVEGEFDLQLDDLELDLSDIDIDLDELAETPVVQAPRSAPVSLATPIAPSATVSAAAVAPIAAAQPRIAPAAAASQPAPAAVRPPAPEFDFTDEPLAFDPAEISEQDEHLESIAQLDVPDVPVPESKPAPTAFTHEYDLDLDGELATLFEQPATPPTTAVQRPAAAPVSAAAAAKPVAATAPGQAPRPASQPANGALPPMDDFEAFERALEEDFRHTLDRPSEYAAANAGRINIPVEPKGLSRFGSRGLLMAGTAVVVLLLGGGGLYAWLTGPGGAVISSGEPQVIAADKDPVKILPEDPGGKSVPNQDKAVYDRVAGAVEDPKQESLISSSEEPVDVVQKTLIPETLPLEGESEAQALGTPVGETEDPRLLPDETGAAQPAQPDSAEAPTITPRKVRTMIVRPDGTLVAQEVPEEPAAPTLEKPATAEPAATPAPGKPALAAPSTASEPAAPAATANAPTGPVPTARPATRAETAAAAPAVQAPAPAAPTEAAAPAQPAASPAPAPAAPETAAAQPQTAAGGYYIQVASLPSQAEAEKSYKNISSKFGSVVGGRAYEIKRAEISGKGTYYRVRISAGSKADAAALCERYKAAGGSCLVTK